MMNTPSGMRWLGCTVLGLLLAGSRLGFGQEGSAPDAGKPAAPAAKPAVASPAAEKEASAPAKASAEAKPAPPSPPPAPARGPFRPLSPSAMKTVDSMRQVEETVSRHDLVELLASNPKLDWAKEVPFRREIWALQFRFKPMRMIFVDLPQPSGMMQRKQIWYMVYNVTNPGKTMRPVPDEESPQGAFKVEYVDKPIRFVPSFLFQCPQLDKSYPDRVIPAAMGPIRTREDPNRTFFNSIEIVREIPVGETVWGIATWEDIDPRTDRFSVYVGGLTNAYRWSDEEGKFKPGSPLGTGRRLQKKTLKLNFWRPGDEFNPKEREIRFGVPGGVDYEWVYR